MSADTTKLSWRCFSPTAGIFAGIFLGWVIHFNLPPEAGFMLDLATRTLDLIVAIIGWAIGTALYGKQIHCGGSRPSNKETRTRYVSLSILILPLLMLAPIFLIKEQILFYFIDALILLSVIGGEIKSGRPFWFLSGEEIS